MEGEGDLRHRYRKSIIVLQTGIGPCAVLGVRLLLRMDRLDHPERSRHIVASSDRNSVGPPRLLIVGPGVDEQRREVEQNRFGMMAMALRAAGIAAGHAFADSAADHERSIEIRSPDMAFCSFFRFKDGGCLREFFVEAGIAWIGSGSEVMEMALSKPRMKLRWHSYGVPTPDWHLVRKNADGSIVRSSAELFARASLIAEEYGEAPRVTEEDKEEQASTVSPIGDAKLKEKVERLARRAFVAASVRDYAPRCRAISLPGRPRGDRRQRRDRSCLHPGAARDGESPSFRHI